jgi:pentatricopeptide repeat protein
MARQSTIIKEKWDASSAWKWKGEESELWPNAQQVSHGHVLSTFPFCLPFSFACPNAHHKVARGQTSSRRSLLKWYSLAVNPVHPCITTYRPDSLSQRLQRHPPPQDRSKRRNGPSLARTELDRVFRAKNKPWPLNPHSRPSPGITAFNLRLGQSVDMGHPLKLVETLKEMKECAIRPDILTYNSAMELFGKHAMEDEAWALMDDMKAAGIMPDTETYKFLLQVHLMSNTHLNSPLMFFMQSIRFARHDATWLALEMMQVAGIEHTESTYALLIQRYLDDSNLEMAFKFLVEMERRGLSPTLKTAEGVITLAAQRRMPRLALELAENFEASSVRRLSTHVWVSCLLSASESLYVGIIANCLRTVGLTTYTAT